MSSEVPFPFSQMRKVVATASAGAVLAVSLSGCFGGGDKLRKDEPLCGKSRPPAAASTTIFPDLAEQIRCIYPELTGRNAEVVDISPNARLINFTKHHIDPTGLKQTYNFFENLASTIEPTYADEDKAGIFTLTVRDKTVQGYDVPNGTQQKIFILAPSDTKPQNLEGKVSGTSVFGKDSLAHTLYAVRLYPDRQANISIILADPPPATSVLGSLNTEFCQSLVSIHLSQGGSQDIAEASLDVRYTQEGVCNTLADALTAVQKNISREDFRKRFSMTIPHYYSGTPLIGLDGSIYNRMGTVKPAIAA